MRLTIIYHWTLRMRCSAWGRETPHPGLDRPRTELSPDPDWSHCPGILRPPTHSACGCQAHRTYSQMWCVVMWWCTCHVICIGDQDMWWCIYVPAMWCVSSVICKSSILIQCYTAQCLSIVHGMPHLRVVSTLAPPVSFSPFNKKDWKVSRALLSSEDPWNPSRAIIIS